MEKAKLIVEETKPKKLIAKLYFIETGKTMPFQDFKPKDKSLNNTEVDVERLAGKVVKVQHGEQVIYPTAASQPSKKPTVDRQRPSYQQHSSRDTHRSERTTFQERSLPSQPTNVPMQIAHVEHVQHPASAPYNFIPLNEKVVEVPTPIPPYNQYDTNRHTGWIDLTIETKTPLYIRNTREQGKENKDNPDFFSPGGKICIPGSSLRGMIRNLVEIVSFGKFVNFDDRRLYFRGLADISNLRKEYQERMSSFDRNSRRPLYKMSAGVIRKDGLRYYIVPAAGFEQILYADADRKIQQLKPVGKEYKHFKCYKLQEGYLVKSGKMQNKKRDWIIRFPLNEAQKIQIPPEDVYHYSNDKTHNDKKHEDVPNLIELAKICKEIPCFYVIRKDKAYFSQEEYQQFLKRFPDAEYVLYSRLIDTEKEDGIYIDVESITQDEKTMLGTEAFNQLMTIVKPRISFGHTAMFRLAYEKTIGDHIPLHLKKTIWKITEERLDWIRQDPVFVTNKKNGDRVLQKLQHLLSQQFDNRQTFEHRLKKEEVFKDIQDPDLYQQVILKHTQVIDLTEAIFGNEKLFPGRVFFEDAICEKQTPQEALLGDGETVYTPKILSSPKPTTFQHYLVQSSDNSRNLYNYNSPQAAIRGYKLYWHKSGNVELWQEDPEALEKLKKDGKDDTQHTAIRPVKPNIRFNGQIRFENLTEIELGALLFALDLPKGCYHKLGMGKPLGLGSVKITPKLYLSSRQERYKNLFAEWESHTEEREKSPYIDKFQQSVLKAIGQTQIASLWQTDRLERLEAMLNWKKGLALELEGLTRYMNITPQNEFKNRPILPLSDKSLPVETESLSETVEVILTDKQADTLDVKKNDIAQPDRVYIKDVEIMGLWGKYNILWKNLDPNVNVLIGINGSGKSTILRELDRFLKNDSSFQQDRNKWKIVENLVVTFNTGFSMDYSSLNRSILPDIVNTCYISTFDAPNDYSLNGETISFSDSLGKQLIQQLNEEITNFYRYKNDQEGNVNEVVAREKQLIDLINLLFKETNKTFVSFEELIDDHGKPVAFITFRQNEQFLTSFDLSSGEKQMLIILFNVVNQLLSVEQKQRLSTNQQLCLILMDEPEISLHLAWQLKLIEIIQQLNKNCQLIIATHAPGIFSDGWNDNITKIKNITFSNELKQ